LRLGWSHGDDEVISRNEAISWFDLGGIGKSPARFDMDKLTAINSHYISAASDDHIIKMITDAPLSPEIETRLRLLAPAIKERAQLVTDLPVMANFALSTEPPEIEEDAKSMLDEDMLGRLKKFADAYDQNNTSIQKMNQDELKAWLNGWLEGQGMKMRDLGPGLRVALTGKKQAPDIILILETLGPEEVKNRIETVCNK
jgi:glutamyl-tRNA synthetase